MLVRKIDFSHPSIFLCLFIYPTASEEMKRKMYSCILIVGGGAKFKSIDKWLQSRLALQIPVAYRPGMTNIFFAACVL